MTEVVACASPPPVVRVARSMRDDCAAAGVPFLFKQTGSVLAKEWGLRDAKGEDPRELPTDLRVRPSGLRRWPGRAERSCEPP